jgi:hypothetical protein
MLSAASFVEVKFSTEMGTSSIFSARERAVTTTSGSAVLGAAAVVVVCAIACAPAIKLSPIAAKAEEAKSVHLFIRYPPERLPMKTDNDFDR